MPIYAKAGPDFKPAPSGTHAGVCVDVVDLGMVTSDYRGVKKSQHKVRIVWQINEAQDNGKPFTVSQRYTLSLHQKASLRKDLESWRGKPFSEEELGQFDLEKLIGVGALLNVIHESREGTTYANVASVMRLMKNMSAPPIREYTRVIDRKPAQQDATGAPQAPWDDGEYPYPDDDVPF